MRLDIPTHNKALQRRTVKDLLHDREVQLYKKFLKQGRDALGGTFKKLMECKLSREELFRVLYHTTDFYRKPICINDGIRDEIRSAAEVGVFAGRGDGVFVGDLNQVTAFMTACVSRRGDASLNSFLKLAGNYLAHGCEIDPEKNSSECIPPQSLPVGKSPIKLLVVASGVYFWDAIVSLPHHVKIHSLDPCPIVTGLTDELTRCYNFRHPKKRRDVTSLEVSLQEANFKRESYDCIHLRNVLTYVPTLPKHFSHLVDALTVGGRLIVQCRKVKEYEHALKLVKACRRLRMMECVDRDGVKYSVFERQK